MSWVTVNEPPDAAAFDFAASRHEPISWYPSGCASRTFMPKRVKRVMIPCGDRERLRVARRVGPAHRHRPAREPVGELLAQPEQVGERLRRMVDVALQVDDRHDAVVARGGEVVVDPVLGIAHEAVAFAEDEVVADAERVRIHAQHRAGLDRGLAVADLGRGAVDDDRLPAETRRGAGPATTSCASTGRRRAPRRAAAGRARERGPRRSRAWSVSASVHSVSISAVVQSCVSSMLRPWSVSRTASSRRARLAMPGGVVGVIGAPLLLRWPGSLERGGARR